MKTLKGLINEVKKRNKIKKISVACAEDLTVLSAIELAYNQGIIDAVLVGNESKIKQLIQDNDLNLKNVEIINEQDPENALLSAVKIVVEGKCDLIMKGLLSTSAILKEILKKENNLRRAKLLSHVSLFNIPSFDKTILLTDAAMNISPSYSQLKEIVSNAIEVSKNLGVNQPKVALISAVEKVTDKMESTVNARKLEEENINGWQSGSIIRGPYALDNALSKESARIKGIESEVAGNVDILVVPNIECGNVLYKSINYCAGLPVAGIIVGAKVPIVLTSRSDSNKSKLYSIALAALM